jgi:hypothetical protein
MPVQGSRENTTVPFLRSGPTLVRESETILQDAGRVDPLVPYTLMAQIAATKKWVPFTDEAAVDGTALAKGIYVGDEIAAADLVAGDVVDVPIVVGGAAATFTKDDLVIENAKTLDTVVAAGAIEAHRVEDDLNRIGLFAEDSVDIDEFET